MLPTSCMLSADLLSVDLNVFKRGGCGVVYQGTLNGSKVCVKRLQVYTEDDQQQVQKVRY